MFHKLSRAVSAAAMSTALAAVLVLSGAEIARGHKKTPPPCAADGTCYPNRQTWGYYTTRWKPWPGEGVKSPTAADDIDEQLQLDQGPITPDPSKEGIAGAEAPENDQSAPGAADQMESAPPVVEPAPGPGVPDQGPLQDPLDIDLPGTPEEDPAPEFDLDAFDPFGQQAPAPPAESEPVIIAAQPIVEIPTSEIVVTDEQDMAAMGSPRIAQMAAEANESPDLPPLSEEPIDVESIQAPTSADALPPGLDAGDNDAPPPLPASLRSAFGQQGRRAATAPRTASAAHALVQPGAVRATANRPRSAASTIQRASWVGDSGIRLVNPAAAIDRAASEKGVQQAIYIEATDH